MKHNHLFNTLLKSFFQGIMIIGPVGLTVLVIWYIVSAIDNSIPPFQGKFTPVLPF